MSWVAVGVAVVGGVVSYVGAEKQNSAAKKASKGQGQVDSTTTRNPYAPASPYLDAGAQAAYQALFGQGAAPPGQTAGPAIMGDPRATAAAPTTGGKKGGGGGGTYGGYTAAQLTADPSLVSRLGGSAAAKWAKSGGGGGVVAGPAGAPAPRAFDGMSQETDDIRRSMMTNLPQQNAGLYNTAQGYVTDTLEGSTRNPLIDRASAAADDIAEDPGLQEYINSLRSGLGIGGGGANSSGGKNVRTGYAANASGGSATSGASNRGKSATGTDEALRKLVAGEDSPGLAAQADAISRQVNEGRADNIRQLRARAVGSGFYGGSIYNELETGAVAQGDQELADSLAAARFGAYQNALGLGTQYDLGIADLDSRERVANANASAAGAGAAADAASREKLAMYGLWGDALAQGEQGRFGRASQLGDLAGLVSNDQQAALSGANAIGGSRRADLGAAGELSLGADANRNDRHASDNSLAGVRAGVNLGRQELAFDRERFYDPFARVSAYTDVIGGLYGGLGSETTQGTDTRSTAPAPYSSPWAAALTGAAVGGQVGSAYQQRNKTAPAATTQSRGAASADPYRSGW